MIACEVIKKIIESKGIKQSFIADKVGMPRELLRRSIEGKRVLKADEFIKICAVLGIDLELFSEAIQKKAV